MKTKILLFTIVILFYYSCNDNKLNNGKVHFSYSNTTIVGNDTIDNSKNPMFPNYSDSLVVRFMKDYKNENVLIYLDDNLYKKIDTLITNKSLGYSYSLTIPLITNKELRIKMRGKIYRIPLKSGYYFMDLFMNENNILDVNYSNTILILSDVNIHSFKNTFL